MNPEAQSNGCPASAIAQQFSPFDIAEPFPFYELARKEEPIFYSSDLDYWVVTKHKDIKSIFGDWKTFSSENAQAPIRPFCDEAKQILKTGGFTVYSGLSARVPPDHTRLRKIVNLAFGPKRFRAIEPRIKKQAATMVANMASKGRVDYVKELAYDFPVLTIFKLLGVPEGDLNQVKEWALSRALMTWGDLTDEEQVHHAHNMVKYWNYCCELVKKRHKEITDDLPGDLVKAQSEGKDISDDEIAAICYSQLFAGHETTTSLLTNSLNELLTHQTEWNAICEDASLIPNAIEEILRFAPSIIAWRRKALADAEIGGVKLPKDANILLLLGSANRDEEVFSNATEFNIRRENSRDHISFGFGVHFCLGSVLAKMQVSAVLNELREQLPHIKLSENQSYSYPKNTSFRAPEQLFVEWEPNS